jgi:NADH-quinone oxidoreductase subunit E
MGSASLGKGSCMFKLSDEGLKFVQKELKRYETKESAIIPALFKVQQEHEGWVPPEAIAYLSKAMDIPEARINEVFHFYTMFNKKPVGRYHVQVCTNVACCMAGTREILHDFLKEYHVQMDQVSSDGKFTFSHVECLGSCGTAPMLQINDKYYENLTPESAQRLLRELK